MAGGAGDQERKDARSSARGNRGPGQRRKTSRYESTGGQQRKRITTTLEQTTVELLGELSRSAGAAPYNALLMAGLHYAARQPGWQAVLDELADPNLDLSELPELVEAIAAEQQAEQIKRERLALASLATR